MEDLWNQLKASLSEGAARTLLSIALALLVLLIGLRIIKWAMRLLKKSHLSARMDPTARSFLLSVVSIGLKLLLVVAVAGIMGVSNASIVAVLGSAGLAIGLAMQGSLANLAGGVMILLFKPFIVGDLIELKSGEIGKVTGISIFYTTLCTLDNRKLVVPNGTVSNASVTNFSAMPQRRVDIDFSAAYASDGELVKRLILETAARHEKIHDEPAPFARLTRMEDSALIFTFRGWCDTADYWDVFYDMNEQVKRAFDENGVAIPFPQMDVHVNADGQG